MWCSALGLRRPRRSAPVGELLERDGLEDRAHRDPAELTLSRLVYESVSVDLPLVVTYRPDGWNVLADATRRTIFERLAEGPRSVGELASELPVSRPAVSQHLKVLKDAGLVVDRPVGTRRVYQLNPDGVGALRATLDGFWTKSLAAYKAAAEQPTEEI